MYATSAGQTGTLQAFGTYDVANITCPVLAVMGTEDVLLGERVLCPA